MAQHTARKRFGQNFLVDSAIIDAIIRAIAPRSVDTLIEIGPGLSALTAPLADYVQPLTVIEIDNDLVRRLRHQYPTEKLHIIHQDVLTVDFNQWNQKVRVVGNLPYNISSPLLFHLLDYRHSIVDQHFMLQKEVVDRMVALPDTKAYSRLSVQLQAYYYIEQLFEVPPTAFNPPPKVTSSIVRMVPLPIEQQLVKYPQAFAKVVTQAFMQRRKMLRKGLGDWVAVIDWASMPFEPTDRAEVLSVQAFNTLTTHLVEDCRVLPFV